MSMTHVDDVDLAAALRTMKLFALSLLVGAGVLYVIARSISGTGWGYVTAYAEAAMVGGLADWFAVTALFRHPLGLPIPHTAVIPNRKASSAQPGRVRQENFLASEVVTEKCATPVSVGRVSGVAAATGTNGERTTSADGVGGGARRSPRRRRAGCARAQHRRSLDSEAAPRPAR